MLPSNKKINWLKKTTTIFAVVFVVVFLFGIFQNVGAQQDDTFGVSPVEENIALSGTDIRVVVAQIIRAVLGLLGIISVSLIIYAGYTIMTAGGSEEKISQGKKILINAVIGLAIIMSAFTIVSFVINALSGATGIRGDGRVSVPPYEESFAGSGSLGEVVRDHFPFRDQKDVPRNTRIAVTFTEAVEPSSFIENTNNTCWEVERGVNGDISRYLGPTSTCVFSGVNPDVPYYGDCLNNRDDFDWQRDCDHLVTSSVQIAISEDIKESGSQEDLVRAVALAVYEKNSNNAYSFVFKPFSLLGSDVEDVWHEVLLTDDIKKKVGEGESTVGIFEGQFHNFYLWKFQTNTEIDVDPPVVLAVFPASEKTVKRNVIVQVYFSEAVDPTVVQGTLGPDSAFYNLIFNNQSISGSWNLSSGYTLAEFVSDEECGKNSCGKMMYCLPVGCGGDGCVDDTYGVLIRTARLFGANSESFEAIPFSGVYDMAGNALDGVPDGLTQGQPKFPNGLIEELDKQADNYYWGFSIENSIDRTPPYIVSVVPGVDAENLDPDADFQIEFSKLIWAASLFDNIQVEEYPDVVGGLVDDTFWSLPYAEKVFGMEKTLSIIKHRKFGPNDLDLYYFPKISSQLQDVNQQCFYPGFGPKSGEEKIGSNLCNVVFDEISGQVVSYNEANCVGVNLDSDQDTGCIENPEDPIFDLTQPNIETCITDIMKNPSVSPTNL